MTRRATRAPQPWLETPRLALRAFVDADPRVVRFVGNGKPTSREAVAASLARIQRYGERYPDLGVWYAMRSDTGAFIGWFALKYVGKSADVEVGYRLCHDAWGQGYATEGATELVRFGFDTVGLERIIGVTHPHNHASQNVLMRAGLADRGWGRYYDQRLRLFAATRDEWRPQR